jgi:hypothetical protein
MPSVDPGATDRRSSPREAFRRPVHVETRDGHYTGLLTSVSRVGAFVVLAEPIPLRTPLTITIELASGSLTLRGSVIRSGPSDDGDGIGIVFAPMPPALQSSLDRLFLE